MTIHATRTICAAILLAFATALPAAETAAAPASGTAEARFGLQFDPVEFNPPAINHAELENGITIDHYGESEVPLITVLLSVRAGSVNDPEGEVGTALLTAETIRTGGAESVPGDELDRELDAHGAQLEASADREQTIFRLSVLAEDLEWGLGLLHAIVTKPAFPAERFEENRGRHLVDLRQRLDVPRDVAQALYPQLIYGKGNPWGWTMTSRSLAAIDIAKLQAFHSRWYQPARMKLGFAGYVDYELARFLASKTFGRIPAATTDVPELPEVEPIAQTRVHVVPRPITQNVIYAGHEGISRFDDDKFAVKLFNAVLSGGFTARLMREIRSDRGLAYAVFGMLGEGTRRGIYFNVAMTKVESTSQVLGLMLGINRDLTAEPPTPAEMELAKQSEINSFVFFFDTAEKLVRQKMTLDMFGYPEDYLNTYVDNLEAVTGDEVRAAAAEELHLDRIVILIVGAIDDPLRAMLEKTYGPVTTITEEQLRADWL